MSTVIRTCINSKECHHAFQDKRNGKGKRVMNVRKTSSGQPPEYRCTVCGQVQR